MSHPTVDIRGGRVGETPELKKTPTGNMYCDLVVFTKTSWVINGCKRSSSQRNVVRLWGKHLKVLRNCSVGRQVNILAEVKNVKYQNAQGVDSYLSEFIVYDIQLLGGQTGTDSSKTDHTNQNALTETSF